jgi:hypothetical protein
MYERYFFAFLTPIHLASTKDFFKTTQEHRASESFATSLFVRQIQNSIPSYILIENLQDIHKNRFEQSK